MSTTENFELDIDTTNEEQQKTFFQKVKFQIKSILAQNLSPSLLALSIAIGFTCGLFPVPGLTSLVCLFICMFLPVNQAAAQIVNLLLTPLDIICVPLFVWFGETILSRDHISLSPVVLMEELKKDKLQAVQLYGSAFVYAIIGWIVWTPFTIWAMHKILTPILRFYMKKKPVS